MTGACFTLGSVMNLFEGHKPEVLRPILDIGKRGVGGGEGGVEIYLSV